MRSNLTLLSKVLVSSPCFKGNEESAETDFGKFSEVDGNLLTFPSV
jgi:hypothetical protein